MTGIIAICMLASLSSAFAQSSPCAMGESQYEGRNYSQAQPFLWTCVLSGEASQENALHLAWTYRALKNYENGMSKVNSALQRAPENENLLYIAAYLYFRNGEQSKVLALLSKAYKLKPDDWRVHQLFAMSFIELNMTADAEQELLRAIKMKPTEADIYYQLARLYYSEYRFQDSINASDKALTLAPEYSEVYDNLGLCYQATQDITRATENYKKAIDLNLKHGVPNEWPLINYSTLLSNQSPAKAIPILQQALVINPFNAEANYEMGRTLQEMGRTAEAISAFEKSITVGPRFASSYYALALLVRRTDPARAAALLKQFKLLTGR